MKQFAFALEKILELRKHYEQEAKIELGRAISVLTEIENNIKINAVLRSQAAEQRFTGIFAVEANGTTVTNDITVTNDTDVTNTAITNDTVTDATVTGAISMLAWDNYILRLEQEAQRLTEAAIKAEAVVEEKRSAYLEASRELKVMEKLKEKREKEYHEEVLAAETLERDDTWRPRAVDG